MSDLGKALIFIGLLLLVFGIIVSLAPRIPWLGQLPGDIIIRRDRFTFYFPLATSLIISVIISLVLYLFRR